MKMYSITTLALAVIMVSACATTYEFRNDDRPPYDRQVDTAGFDQLSMDGVTLLDVRLAEDYADDPQIIPDAMYRDPESIETWAAQMSPADGPVVVYCVRGHWVSQKAANYLNDKGFDVYTLDGGIEGWKNAGRPTVSVPRQGLNQTVRSRSAIAAISAGPVRQQPPMSCAPSCRHSVTSNSLSRSQAFPDQLPSFGVPGLTGIRINDNRFVRHHCSQPGDQRRNMYRRRAVDSESQHLRMRCIHRCDFGERRPIADTRPIPASKTYPGWRRRRFQ